MALLSGQDFSTLLVQQPFCKQWMSVDVTRFRGRRQRGQQARSQHARELHVFVVLPAISSWQAALVFLDCRPSGPKQSWPLGTAPLRNGPRRMMKYNAPRLAFRPRSPNSAVTSYDTEDSLAPRASVYELALKVSRCL